VYAKFRNFPLRINKALEEAEEKEEEKEQQQQQQPS